MIHLNRLLRLFVLVAMTLSIGEGVWISMCVQMPGMDSQAAAADGMDDMPGMPGMPGSDHDPGGEEGTSCPFGPVVVAQGCATAASLPASAGVLFAVSQVNTAGTGSFEVLPERLYATPPFHPPRA